MRVIFKYPLKLIEVQTIKTIGSPKALTVQVQNGVACLWVEGVKSEEAEVVVSHLGTGHATTRVEDSRYLATYQQGPYVWHVYVRGA